MFQAPLPTLLRASSIAWLIGLGLPSFLLYVLKEEGFASEVLWRMCLAGGVIAATSLFLLSFMWKRAPTSVASSWLLAGVLAFVPILLSTSAMALLYLVTLPPASATATGSLVLAVSLYWCWRSIAKLKVRLEDRRFFEKEFTIEVDRIVVRYPAKTDLGPSPEYSDTVGRRLLNWIGPRLVVLIPLAYPIQRLLSDASGLPAVLLFLSVLSVPLAIYILGRMACGAYLWIYRVRRIEQQVGKRVVFAEPRIEQP